MKSVFHFTLLLCLASVLVTEVHGQSCCPSGWTSYGSRCFFFYNIPVTWHNAESICTSFGGHLASVHSSAEQRFIRTLTIGHPKTWIGGTDAKQEGHWEWTDGTSLGIQCWYPGEPNNLGGEHCMEMNFRGNYWNDQSCNDKRPFVCARRI